MDQTVFLSVFFYWTYLNKVCLRRATHEKDQKRIQKLCFLCRTWRVFSPARFNLGQPALCEIYGLCSIEKLILARILVKPGNVEKLPKNCVDNPERSIHDHIGVHRSVANVVLLGGRTSQRSPKLERLQLIEFVSFGGTIRFRGKDSSMWYALETSYLGPQIRCNSIGTYCLIYFARCAPSPHGPAGISVPLNRREDYIHTFYDPPLSKFIPFERISPRSPAIYHEK